MYCSQTYIDYIAPFDGRQILARGIRATSSANMRTVRQDLPHCLGTNLWAIFVNRSSYSLKSTRQQLHLTNIHMYLVTFLMMGQIIAIIIDTELLFSQKIAMMKSIVVALVNNTFRGTRITVADQKSGLLITILVIRVRILFASVRRNTSKTQC